MGAGAYSELTAAATAACAPDKMAEPIITSHCSSEFSCSFIQPESNGEPIVAYALQYKESECNEWTLASSDISADATEYTAVCASGLLPNTKYVVQVRASNHAGAGAWSNASFTTDAAVPSALAQPTVTATGGHSALLVHWQAPASMGGLTALTEHTLQVLQGDTVIHTFTLAGSVTEHTVEGLNAKTTYLIKVCASNAVGAGAYSELTAAATAGYAYEQAAAAKKEAAEAKAAAKALKNAKAEVKNIQEQISDNQIMAAEMKRLGLADAPMKREAALLATQHESAVALVQKLIAIAAQERKEAKAAEEECRMAEAAADFILAEQKAQEEAAAAAEKAVKEAAIKKKAEEAAAKKIAEEEAAAQAILEAKAVRAAEELAKMKAAEEAAAAKAAEDAAAKAAAVQMLRQVFARTLKGEAGERVMIWRAAADKAMAAQKVAEDEATADQLVIDTQQAAVSIQLDTANWQMLYQTNLKAPPKDAAPKDGGEPLRNGLSRSRAKSSLECTVTALQEHPLSRAPAAHMQYSSKKKRLTLLNTTAMSELELSHCKSLISLIDSGRSCADAAPWRKARSLTKSNDQGGMQLTGQHAAAPSSVFLRRQAARMRAGEREQARRLAKEQARHNAAQDEVAHLSAIQKAHYGLKKVLLREAHDGTRPAVKVKKGANKQVKLKCIKAATLVNIKQGARVSSVEEQATPSGDTEQVTAGVIEPERRGSHASSDKGLLQISLPLIESAGIAHHLHSQFWLTVSLSQLCPYCCWLSLLLLLFFYHYYHCCLSTSAFSLSLPLLYHCCLYLRCCLTKVAGNCSQREEEQVSNTASGKSLATFPMPSKRSEPTQMSRGMSAEYLFQEKSRRCELGYLARE